MKLSRRTLLKSAFAALATLSLPSWAAMRRGGGSLTAVERADLVFMREEEKLARDVYTILGEKWGNAIFFNIASSEQRHMDSILNLLVKYGVPDPAAGKAIGVFVNTELQQLFNDLVAFGKVSNLNALKVGGIIEETDVQDIVVAIDNTTKTDIRNVYTNLLNGSYNHLRAFAGQIEALTGMPYVAQVISQEEVDAILGR